MTPSLTTVPAERRSIIVETVAPVATAAVPTINGAQPTMAVESAAAHDKRQRVRLIILFLHFFKRFTSNSTRQRPDAPAP